MSLPPMPRLVDRAELVTSHEVEQSLAHVKRAHGLDARRRAAKEFAAEVEDGRASYGGMLARVWHQAQRTLSELEADGEMAPLKRIAALRDVARLMPLLAKAEAQQIARIGGVAVEDMSDGQLERELRQLKKRRKRRRTQESA